VTPAPQPGLGVDSTGGAVIDPTANVQALNEASSQRQDDLRALTKELVDVKIASLTETIKTFAIHQRELDRAESDRLNSIRQVDREEVTKTAAANQAAITTLATSTATLAETLRTQVAVTASAAESRQSASTAEMTKRLSALELSASASMGKSTVSDPQMERLVLLVERLATAQQVGTGKAQGMSDTAKIVIAVVGLAATGVAIVSGLLGIAGVLYAVLKP
jgi:hypothetical protein